MLQAHETIATIDRDGVLWPSQTTLYAVMAMQSELNGRMLEIVRELAGAAMITLPSSVKDFDNPDMAKDIGRYMQSASTDARTRVATLRMAWDFIGSEFGSRHQQYEKFYGGASFLVKMNVFRAYDFKRATAMGVGALRRFEGADPVHEIGGITEVAAGMPDCPAVLFDSIKGFPRGFRVFTNA